MFGGSGREELIRTEVDMEWKHQDGDCYYRITANEIEAKGKRVAATIQINAPLLKDLRSSVRYHLMKMLSLILRL